MNTIKILCLSALSMLSATALADDQITVVERPALATSANYTAFRAPLSGGRLLKLPVGQV